MTNAELKARFIYEPTGTLRQALTGQRRTSYPWRPACREGRYLVGTFRDKEGKMVTYYLHRLVWQFFHGEVPSTVDHINNNPRDNRIENLRVCTPADNRYNVGAYRNNQLGVKGVQFYPAQTKRPYVAQLTVNGKVRRQSFATLDQAASAYKTWITAVAGEFART